LLVAALAASAPRAGAQTGAGDSFVAVTSLFAYDAALPLNARVVQKTDTVAFVREKIVYDGWRGSRVPSLLAIPKNGAPRHPVIILVDGIGGWKERWWQATSWNRGRILIDSLLDAGFAVAMADAPASGERTYENDFVSAESFIRKLPQWRDMGTQNAIETRRLMDYLVSRPEIDSSRIGMLGLSHGGMMTFAIAAMDPRVKVAIAGLAPLQNVPDVLLPTNFASHVTVPFVMFAATNDTWYRRDQVTAAFNAIAAKDKRLVWYDGGHRPPPEYAALAVQLFRRVLAR
jgi:dienelactone hydrolase